MITRPSSARISPLEPIDRSEWQIALMEELTELKDARIFATIIRHPGLFRYWRPFGAKLLRGKIPPRDREIVILRTAHLCGAAYEWGQHVVLGRKAGLTDEEIEHICLAEPSGQWSDHEKSLLNAVDELHVDACISEKTWVALSARFDQRQMIELPMLVGQYHLVAFTTNSLGIEPDEGLPAMRSP
jgi:4-carboxymuconolactone decarboxylase